MKAVGVVDVAVQQETSIAIQAYLKRLNSQDLSPLTIAKYTHDLKGYQLWLSIQPVSEYSSQLGKPISKDSAEEFINFLRSQRNLSRSSVRSYYHAIKPFLAGLGINFTHKFKKIKRLPQYYKPAQIKAILDVAINRTDKWKRLSGRDSLMILVFAFTGIRKGELMALRVKDISFYAKTIYIRGRERGGGAKGDNDRTVPIDHRIYKLLEDYTRGMQPTNRVFPLSSSRIGVIVKKYSIAAGLPEFSPHKFRHYFATQLARTRTNPLTGVIEPGKNPKTVQQLLGHASIETTQIYFDIAPEDHADAVTHLPNLMEDK